MTRAIRKLLSTVAFVMVFCSIAHPQEAQLNVPGLCQLEGDLLKSEKDLSSSITAEQATHPNPVRLQMLLKQLGDLKTNAWNSRVSFFNAKLRTEGNRYNIIESKEPFTTSAKIVKFDGGRDTNMGFGELNTYTYGIWAVLPCSEPDPILVVSITIHNNSKPPTNLIIGTPYSDLTALAGALAKINVNDVVTLTGEIYFDMLNDTAFPTPMKPFSPRLVPFNDKTLIVYNATISDISPK
jgi:hypothetical protein